jgi:hypothetical protein
MTPNTAAQLAPAKAAHFRLIEAVRGYDDATFARDPRDNGSRDVGPRERLVAAAVAYGRLFRD